MPRYIITTRTRLHNNGIRIEPGMTVEVVTQNFGNPINTNGGQQVVDAFMRLYGIDIRRAGALSSIHLDIKQA